MAAARYWRLVGLVARAGGDLGLSELRLAHAGSRVDAGATLSCTIEPVSGALALLADDAVGAAVRWTQAAITQPGFAIVWDCGSAVVASFVQVGSGSLIDEHLASATLQYSDDAVAWQTLTTIGRYVWPGANTLGSLAAGDVESVMDQASTGGTVNGKSAAVGSLLGARSSIGRSSGKRLFGIRMDAQNGSQQFFAGLSRLASWTGAYSSTESWVWYYYGGGGLYRYPSGALVSLATAPENIGVNGQTMLFELDLGAGALRMRRADSGLWSSVVVLPGWVASDAYVVSVFSPSSGSNQIQYTILTTPTELAGHLEAGVTAWDDIVPGVLESAPPVPRALNMSHVIGAPTGAPATAVALAQPIGLVRLDMEFGGVGRITGTTKRKATPDNIVQPARRVRLHRDRDGLLARETWSGADGTFVFDGLSTDQTFTALAFDHTSEYETVAASRRSPEVTP